MRHLLPLPADRLRYRSALLLGGLVTYGLSSGLILQAGLGVDPWDVLGQGLARTVGGQTGTWTVVVSGLVLLLWLPLRERYGVGTLANAVIVGLVIDLTQWLVPAPRELAARGAVLFGAVLLTAFATGLYIAAGYGPGPRDGLVLAIARRGHTIRWVRIGIEATVVLIGWLLGGSVGVGTLIYAASMGPLTHVTIPWLGRTTAGRRRRCRPAPA